MFSAKEFEARFRELLEAMDAVCEQAAGDDAEAMEELNAEFEDALFLLGEIDPKHEDANDEYRDALEEFGALLADYRKLTPRVSALAEPVQRLQMLIDMAGQNL